MKTNKFLALALASGLVLSSCGNSQPATTEPAQPAQEVETTETEVVEETTPATDITEAPAEEDSKFNTMPQVGLTLDDALKAYFDHFGDDTISIIEISLDHDDGFYQYEIEGFKDGTEYDATIDANTGEVIEMEKDDDEDGDAPIDINAIIKPEEAIEKALATQAEGAYVEEWSLEVDDGRTVYELDIENGDDVEIDAMTGEVYED